MDGGGQHSAHRVHRIDEILAAIGIVAPKTLSRQCCSLVCRDRALAGRSKKVIISRDVRGVLWSPGVSGR